MPGSRSGRRAAVRSSGATAELAALTDAHRRCRETRPRRRRRRRRRGRDGQVAPAGRLRRRMRGPRASPGPGPRTSRTAAASRTASPGCSPRPIADEHGVDFGHVHPPPPVHRRPRRRSRRAATAAPSPRSPGTPRSPAGRRRRRTCRATRPRSRATLMEVADALRRPPADVDRAAGRRHRRPALARPVERRHGRAARRGDDADRPLIVLAGTRPTGLPTLGRRAPTSSASTCTGLDEPETARLATLVARAAVDADGARSIHERTGRQPAVHRRDGPGVPRGRHARVARRPGRADRDRRRRACRSRCGRCSARASTRSTRTAARRSASPRSSASRFRPSDCSSSCSSDPLRRGRSTISPRRR